MKLGQNNFLRIIPLKGVNADLSAELCFPQNKGSV